MHGELPKADESQGLSDYLANGPRTEPLATEPLRPSPYAHAVQARPVEYRIVEETRGEVTYTESYSTLIDAANSLLCNCGGEPGMPGDTVEEIIDQVEKHGGVTVHPFPGCVWRLMVIGGEV